MIAKKKYLTPTYCPDGQAHVRRLETPTGGLMVGSVCRRCGEARQYRAAVLDEVAVFSLRTYRASSL